MHDRPADLPEFAAPPLAEVALGVLLERLPLKQAHLGLYWTEIRDAFPQLQDHPPLDSFVEGINLGGQGPAFVFERLDSVPIQRSWFIGADASTLVQVQADRFVHNWRGEGADYPRYERLRSSFEERLGQFRDLCEREGLGSLTARQCEVNYVNVIRSDSLASVLVAVDEPRLDVPSVGPAPLDMRFAARYNVQESNNIVARLYVEAEPQAAEPGQYLLNLTVRWPVRVAAVMDVLGYMDASRDIIVRAFTQITTPEMHEQWRRLK